MAAQRLSIWGVLRLTSSMNAKNMASRRGDWRVAPSSPHQAATAAREDTNNHQQKRSRAQSISSLSWSNHGTFLPLFSPLTQTYGRNGKGFFIEHSGDCNQEKSIDLFMIFREFEKQGSCSPHGQVLSIPRASKTGIIPFQSSVRGVAYDAILPYRSEKRVLVAALMAGALNEAPSISSGELSEQ